MYINNMRRKKVRNFFPLTIFILLCFNVLSTVSTCRLPIYVHIYINMTNCRQYFLGLLGLIMYNGGKAYSHPK